MRGHIAAPVGFAEAVVWTVDVAALGPGHEWTVRVNPQMSLHTSQAGTFVMSDRVPAGV